MSAGNYWLNGRDISIKSFWAMLCIIVQKKKSGILEAPATFISKGELERWPLIPCKNMLQESINI
jgi:hypothetical protein